MAEQLTMDCTRHKSAYECADQLVTFIPKFREYGLIVHDGGESFVLIQHCPWCGSALPPSERHRWFETLEARGIAPGVDEVPPPFRDGTWLLEP
ncbi:MAG: hypothetical protein U5R31_17210 [Acidimicrobiia bacterium]|nr:hypothetical protein [Acidimicrobiia bacterium]